MSVNKIQEGRVITYENAGESVMSGQLVKIGDIFGVAGVDIPQNASGAVELEGVFEVPSELSGEVQQGTKLYYKSDTKKVTETGSGNTFCGICFRKAAASDTTVWLRIGYLAEAGE